MVKSGVIFGIVALVLILLVTLISPFCGVCLGLFIGLAAGYVAGVFGKPGSASEGVKMGAVAGAIAGAIGLVGQFIGGVLNSMVVNPTTLEQFYKTFGLPNISLTQTQITTSQILAAGCIGLFNILWMAAFGLAGGALWYQVRGKNQAATILPPQPPVPPSYP
jgi:hypothetical protein